MKKLDVSAGQWVFNVVMGWEKVERVLKRKTYPIETESDIFLADGREMSDDKLPTLYTYNPFDPDDKPPYEYTPGEVICVNEHYYRKFIEMQGNKVLCHSDGISDSTVSWKTHRPLTPEEKGDGC